MRHPLGTDYLTAILEDARARTLELVAGIDGDRLMGPKLSIVNPLLWEIGHVAWFHEIFILRWLDGDEPLIENADGLYDSMAVDHDTRWDLPLPSLSDTLQYMERVNEALAARLTGGMAGPQDGYYYQLTTYHEDMHDEAFTSSRQILGFPRPIFAAATNAPVPIADAGPLAGDVEVPGGAYHLGAERDAPFVFDNEKWEHEVTLEPFAIARAPVTNVEFLAFVDVVGYSLLQFWSDGGWPWRQGRGAEHSAYWLSARPRSRVRGLT